MSNDLWRWTDPEGQQRKVRLDELRSALAGGLIAPNTPVWRSGWKEWQPAHEVPELTTSAVAAANGVVPNIPPPPLAMLSAQKEFEAKAGESFRPPPVGPKVADEEPPPPPRFVPLPVKPPPAPTSSSPIATHSNAPPAPPSSARSVASAASAAPAAPVAPGPPASNAPPPAPAAMQIGSSLPTTLGLPPPPELAQMVANAKAQPAGPIPTGTQLGMPQAPPRPDAKSPGGNGANADPMIEELSGSMLLDEDPSAKPRPPPAPAAGGMPPPTDPVVDGGEGPRDSFGDYVPPRRPNLTAIFDDFQAIKEGRQPKNKLLIGVVGVLALMVLIMLIALVVSLFSGKPSDAKSIASASASSTASPPATETAVATTTSTAAAAATSVAPTASTPPPPPEEPAKHSGPSFGDCTVAGDAHIISPRAFIPSAVESLAVPGAVALGFATTGRDVVALTVDPTSLAITNTVKARAIGGDARRVSPVVMQGKLAVVADVDKRDKLVGRRVIATATPIDVGVADNAIVWAPHGGLSYATMFPLDAEGGPVDAIRGVPLSHTKGVAVAYRRAGAVHVGMAKGDAVYVPAAPTVRIAGLGPQVGSPAIGTTGDSVVVAWADRAAATDPWMVRWAKVDASGTASAPKELALPDGGLGTQAMSPSVAGLGNARFLVAWTEGPVSNHQVRAITLNADGTPSGAALSVSAAGLNAGQPQVAIGADGRGVIAFLAKGKAFYEIHATPLMCPPAK